MSIEKEVFPPINDNNGGFDEMSHERKMLISKYKREQETIESSAKELKSNILSLDTKIHAILNKHHNDYITTFNEFMDTVRKDLKHKIEQMEKVEKEKTKNNDIRIITSERDFFRQEAIRLNHLCKEFSHKLDDMARELRFQASELQNLSKKWKESENTNKQLIVELERNIQINRELENQLKMMNQDNIDTLRINPPPSNKSGHSPIPINTLTNIKNLNNEDIEEKELNKDFLMQKNDKLRNELRKERTRNHKILSEFNKLLMEKNKLEKIFIDCVEECRKDIFNRRIREALTNKTNIPGNSHGNLHNVSYPKFVNDVKYDHFLPTDKRKLIEIFILKEEVINLIKDHIFKKIEDSTPNENKVYNNNDFNQTKSSFIKTDKMFSTFRKKTPSTGLTYTMQFHNLRSKTPNMNY